MSIDDINRNRIYHAFIDDRAINYHGQDNLLEEIGQLLSTHKEGE